MDSCNDSKCTQEQCKCEQHNKVSKNIPIKELTKLNTSPIKALLLIWLVQIEMQKALFSYFKLIQKKKSKHNFNRNVNAYLTIHLSRQVKYSSYFKCLNKELTLQ